MKYCIGSLRLSHGSSTINRGLTFVEVLASVFTESSTTVDITIKGHVTLNWDQAQINAAFDLLRSATSAIVSWKEN